MQEQHFDLRVEHHEGWVSVSLSDPGSFGPPIAEVQGETPDLALRLLFADITIPTLGETITVNGRVAEPGIVPGGSSPNGHYVSQAVVQTALAFGWLDPDAERAAAEYPEWCHNEAWDFFDEWHAIVLDAEGWLNDQTSGGLWLWDEGDFRLTRTADCPECGATFDPDDKSITCPDHGVWE